jgi:hypothetical protein
MLLALPSLILSVIKLFGGAMGEKADRELQARQIASDERKAHFQATKEVRVEEARSMGALMIAEQAWKLTAGIRPAFAYPLAFYYGCVIFYSLVFCEGCLLPQDWTIAALPGQIGEWSWMIVVAYFGGRPIEKVGMGVVEAYERRGQGE